MLSKLVLVSQWVELLVLGNQCVLTCVHVTPLCVLFCTQMLSTVCAYMCPQNTLVSEHFNIHIRGM